MLSDSDVRAFHEQGFLLGGRVLTDAEVDELRGEMERVLTATDFPDGRRPVRCVDLSKAEGRPVWQIVNIWQASDAFARLTRNREIVTAVARLTGAKELRVWHDQVQYKPKDVGGTLAWHQDSPAWPVLTPPVQVSAWVALDDVDRDNGCLWMVEGSHRWGAAGDLLREMRHDSTLPDRYAGHPIRQAPRPVPKGHVHFHHGLTWHASFPNRSGRQRRAIAVHYMPETTRYVAANDHVMKPYITVADGQPMAGPVFPRVYPVGAAEPDAAPAETALAGSVV